LTVAVHTLLHHRALYPPSSFVAARHRGVCAWVNAAVDAVEAQLLRCALRRVALVVFAPRDGAPLERFVFDLDRFPRVAARDRHVPFAPRSGGGGDGDGEEDGDDARRWEEEEEEDGERALRPGNMAEQFRAALAALAFLPRRLAPLPAGCTFNLAVELRDDAAPPPEHPRPWVPVAASLQRHRPGGEEQLEGYGADLGGVLTTPVRAVEAGEMVFEMWVEEARGKMDRLEREAEGDASGGEDVGEKKTASASKRQERDSKASQRRDDHADESGEFSDLSF
jgi:mitotic spindle assembly checkpoint protein MAD2B